MHNVTILNHIFLPFNANFSGFATGRFRFQTKIIAVLYNFSPDKTALKIGMDNSAA